MPLEEDLNRYESLMERLVTAYRARITKICKETELTPPQFFALHTLKEQGQIKMSPLADALGLSMGAASTLIDRLVTRGYVGRLTDPTDRRAVFVNLTEAGHKVLEEANAAKRQLIREIFRELPDTARAQLLNGLEAMVGAWERLPEI